MDVIHQPLSGACSPSGVYLHLDAMKRRHIAAAFLSAMLLVGECVAQPSVTLAGRFEHRTDPPSLEMLGGLVCFYPSSDSAKLLHRPNSDARLAWFCFTNKEMDKKLLGIPRSERDGGCGYAGQAVVEVVNYTPYLEERDGFDTAQLQSVRSLSDAKVLPCE